MRSRLDPMQKVARMLRTHEELLLNWFRAKGELSNGAVEGLNNKIRLVITRILLLRPSTAPFESSPLARNQLSSSSSWVRNMRATFCIGSKRLRMARWHQ